MQPRAVAGHGTSEMRRRADLPWAKAIRLPTKRFVHYVDRSERRDARQLFGTPLLTCASSEEPHYLWPWSSVPGSLSMGELRNQIWDFLYRAGGSRSITDIAENIGSVNETVRLAVQHDWFVVVGDQVTIAHVTS